MECGRNIQICGVVRNTHVRLETILEDLENDCLCECGQLSRRRVLAYTTVIDSGKHKHILERYLFKTS